MRYHRLFVIALVSTLVLSCENESGLDLTAGTGKAGSTARFAVTDNFLYLLDEYQVKVFSFVSGTFKQVGGSSTFVSAETIFATDDFLFLGASDGMYIYSIADRASPAFVFQYQHIRAFDPVVVQGNRAYVTMRSDTTGNFRADVLEIIDISDPRQPALIEDYPVPSPYGLAIDGAVVFVCEGDNGLEVYDVTDEHAMRLIKYWRDFSAMDVIMKDGVATVTGNDGIFQFSYGDVGDDVTLVGEIPVGD